MRAMCLTRLIQNFGRKTWTEWNTRCRSSSSLSTSSLAKHSCLNHGLTKKILQDLPIPPWIGPSGFLFFGWCNGIFCGARSLALRPTPILEDQVSVFMFPSERVAQFYGQAPGSLFIALYGSQGDDGGILTRFTRDPWHRWESNSNINVKEIRHGVDWIHLAQYGDECQAVMNTILYLRVSYEAVNFFSSWATVSFSKGLRPLELVYLLYTHLLPLLTRLCSCLCARSLHSIQIEPTLENNFKFAHSPRMFHISIFVSHFNCHSQDIRRHCA
jgi:hypothetical protein